MSQKYNHCPIPNCKRNVIPGRSSHGLCVKHEEDLDFLLFILPHIRVGAGTSKVPGLFLPGQPGYSVPENIIKQEIQKHGMRV